MIWKEIVDNKNLWGQLLFAEIFFLVFFMSFFPKDWLPFGYSTLYTFIFFTSVLNLTKRRHRRTMIILASGAFALEWISGMFSLHLLNISSQLLNVIFFVTVVGLLIHQVAKAQNADRSVIFEAINGYLLLGVTFSLLIALMILLEPQSYNFSPSEGTTFDVIYYGFVTLSTLGYGDLLPLTNHSKSLALLTTIGGQLYLAVIVALLIGKYSSQKKS